MRCALLITAFDRPQYLAPVVESWRRVRGRAAWHVRAAVEPGPRADEVVGLLDGLADETVVNERRLGVAENPYRHLDALVADGFDFVLRAEDDLLVADDVLELAGFAAARRAPDVAAFCAFSPAGGDAAVLERRAEFCPWVWGTWAATWREVIEPTWDHDYSTFNGSPGFESGWDWNLNTRVLPAHGLGTWTPQRSRVRNIGATGVHGTPDLLVDAPGFTPHLDRRAYRIR